MATQLHHPIDLVEQPKKHGRPTMKVVASTSYSDLERPAPGVASSGVHPGVLGLLVGGYAAMLASFWAFFARDTEAAMVLTVVTVLMLMYFSLLIGGILVAGAPQPHERQRSFREFLRGRVDIFGGAVSGREAAAQILFLPACMVVLATTIGLWAQLFR